jgi:hypothetical protein
MRGLHLNLAARLWRKSGVKVHTQADSMLLECSPNGVMQLQPRLLTVAGWCRVGVSRRPHCIERGGKSAPSPGCTMSLRHRPGQPELYGPVAAQYQDKARRIGAVGRERARCLRFRSRLLYPRLLTGSGART